MKFYRSMSLLVLRLFLRKNGEKIRKRYNYVT